MPDPMNAQVTATTVAGGEPMAEAPGRIAARATGGSVREIVRGLELRGLGASEAGNLAALAYGVWPARSGWTVAQVEHLRFLRAIVRVGALEP
jgi:hypothetical protein